MGKGDKSHGGAREGSGRPPKFESDRETEAIRVPKSSKEPIEKAVKIIDELRAQGFTVEQIEELIKKMAES